MVIYGGISAEREISIISSKEIIKSLRSLNYEVIDIDGVRINFDDGWALIRASNTQPVLVLRFEAVTNIRLKELVKIIKTQMDKYKPLIHFDYEA